MITPVTNQTAINYWLKASSDDYYRTTYNDIASSYNYNICSLERTLSAAHLYHMDPPLSVLFPDAASRTKRADFDCHILPKNIVPESFIKLTDDLYIICPELAFILAARHMYVAELVNLANDLCAIYRRDDISPLGQSGRKQITDIKRLSTYIKHTGNAYGISKARQAVKYALDCSNSPKESNLATLFRLPFSIGGASITDICLNNTIRLSPKAADFLGRDTCCCDICSTRVKTVVEYDSNLTHLDRSQHHYDKQRSTALQMSGYTVITITADDLQSHLSIDKTLLLVRKAMGLQTHMDRFEKYRDVRWEVMDRLFFGKRKDYK